MEDGVTENESLVFPMNNTSSGRGDEEERNQGQDRDKESKGGGGEQGRAASGLIKHIISNLVSGGREDEEHDQEKSAMHRGGKEEEKEAGFLNNLISNLVSPLGSKPTEGINEGQAEDLEVKDEGKSNFGSKEDLGGGGSGGGRGGGIVSHLISNIFHHGEGGGGEKEDNQEVVERKEQVKREEDDGGGGIIDNIVSRFPTPLACDAAPATEEASLLIHSRFCFLMYFPVFVLHCLINQGWY